MTTMTATEMQINNAANRICGCAWEDAPGFATMRERLEWVRDNNMGRGTDGEIDAEEMDSLIAQAEAANV
jgi:hypothetical protein